MSYAGLIARRVGDALYKVADTIRDTPSILVGSIDYVIGQEANRVYSYAYINGDPPLNNGQHSPHPTYLAWAAFDPRIDRSNRRHTNKDDGGNIRRSHALHSERARHKKTREPIRVSHQVKDGWKSTRYPFVKYSKGINKH